MKISSGRWGGVAKILPEYDFREYDLRLFILVMAIYFIKIRRQLINELL